jgi:hypothetical protein
LRIASRGSLLPPALIKERVNAIALAPAEEFRRDSDLFGDAFRNPEAQDHTRVAMERGLQTHDWEMELARMLPDLGERA